jgi:hypothetical protein
VASDADSRRPASAPERELATIEEEERLERNAA